jgi:hypothetical protein
MDLSRGLGDVYKRQGVEQATSKAERQRSRRVFI